MRNLVLSVFGAAVLASPAAMAGPTGNAGAFSTYMFRGVDQSVGAAVQGGVDYATDSGIYVGTWASTILDSYETDLYGGWTGGGFDVGYIFYGYRDATKLNFSEVYAGWSGGGLSAKVYFSPEFANTEENGIYGTLSYALELSDTLSLTPQVGFSSGDGVELTFGDTYTDYSLTLAKTLADGFTFSFGYVANTLDPDDPATAPPSEKGQIVIGLKKSFDL